jgi:anti-anti-sigma factor
MELQVQVECLQDVAVVSLAGRLVRGIALDNLRRRVEQLQRIRMLVLDVSEVSQVDAGGLGTLLTMRRWAVQNAAKIELVNPPTFFRRILDATHLTPVFAISSLKEAICILRAPLPGSRYATA